MSKLRDYLEARDGSMSFTLDQSFKTMEAQLNARLVGKRVEITHTSDLDDDISDYEGVIQSIKIFTSGYEGEYSAEVTFEDGEERYLDRYESIITIIPKKVTT